MTLYPQKKLTLNATAALLSFAIFGLSGCVGSPKKTIEPTSSNPLIAGQATTLKTLYQSIIINSTTQQPLSVQTLAEELSSADVIFIGEFHGNHASHLLQAELQAALYQYNSNQILSMEQFNRDQQPILNQYLEDQIGEAYLIKETPAWDNYSASYRPLVEFAKRHLLPVVAANAPAQTVRCIGREGATYLTKLTTQEQAQIAQQPLQDIAGYRQFFMDFLEGSSRFNETRAQNSYLAQLTRDNTMAESILKAHRANPNAQIIHTNGAFHSNNGLGTVGALKRLNPNLSIKVISPVHVDAEHPFEFADTALTKGDFIYLLQAQPEKYRSASYRKQAFKQMFDKADSKACRGESNEE